MIPVMAHTTQSKHCRKGVNLIDLFTTFATAKRPAAGSKGLFGSTTSLPVLRQCRGPTWRYR